MLIGTKLSYIELLKTLNFQLQNAQKRPLLTTFWFLIISLIYIFGHVTFAQGQPVRCVNLFSIWQVGFNRFLFWIFLQFCLCIWCFYFWIWLVNLIALFWIWKVGFYFAVSLKSILPSLSFAPPKILFRLTDSVADLNRKVFAVVTLLILRQLLLRLRDVQYQVGLQVFALAVQFGVFGLIILFILSFCRMLQSFC